MKRGHWLQQAKAEKWPWTGDRHEGRTIACPGNYIRIPAEMLVKFQEIRNKGQKKKLSLIEQQRKWEAERHNAELEGSEKVSKKVKRYKLKKELPTFKVGDEFHISGRGNLVHTETNIIAYSNGVLHGFPNILQDWFEEIPEKPKTVDDLKEGDECYIITCSTVFFQSPRIEKVVYTPALKSWVEMGELYLTEEEAEKTAAKQRAEVALRRDTKGFKPDIYNLGQDRFYISYDPLSRCLCWMRERNDDVSHQITFATIEDAEASIKAHEKEWKVYLGVEE